MKRPFSALQELGDSTRLSVFLAILGPRKNVSQIVAELGLAQPQVSYHLRKLKDAGLAVEEKDGRWVWYQANWVTSDPNLRDFIDLMARWAGDEGAGSAVAAGGKAEPALVGARPSGRDARPPARDARPPTRDARPEVERPKKKPDTDMDDFLL